MLRLVGWLLALGGAAMCFLRVLDLRGRIPAMATALQPAAVVALVLALLLFLAARGQRTWLAGLLLALAGLVVQALWLAPMFTGPPAGPRRGDRVTVMSLNMRFGQADPAAVVRRVREAHADVLALEECTPRSYKGLKAAGLLQVLPHQAGQSKPGAIGTTVFSRFGLGPTRQLPVANGAVSTRVRAPSPFTLAAIHTVYPDSGDGQWGRDMRALRRIALRRNGPFVMAGDFNASRDHAAFRKVLGTGLRDAAEEANSGIQPTWPAANPGWLPVSLGISLLTIDHVVVSPQVRAVDTEAWKVRGTDHRALVARLVVR